MNISKSYMRKCIIALTPFLLLNGDPFKISDASFTFVTSIVTQVHICETQVCVYGVYLVRHFTSTPVIR